MDSRNDVKAKILKLKDFSLIIVGELLEV